MFVDVKVTGLEFSGSIRKFVDLSVNCALAEYRDWIPRVRLSLSDRSGTGMAEGLRYQCIAAVSMFGQGLIRAEVEHDEIDSAIDEALLAVRLSVVEQIGILRHAEELAALEDEPRKAAI